MGQVVPLRRGAATEGARGVRAAAGDPDAGVLGQSRGARHGDAGLAVAGVAQESRRHGGVAKVPKIPPKYPKSHAHMLAKVPKIPPKYPKAHAQMLAKVPKMSPCITPVGCQIGHMEHTWLTSIECVLTARVVHSRVSDCLHGPYWLSSSIEPCFDCKIT
jgi:hypothetical protein